MKDNDCKKLIEDLKESIKCRLTDEKYKSIPKPEFIIIQVGEKSESVNNQIKDKKILCEELGIGCRVYEYREDITTDKLAHIINRLSMSPLITAISIQCPLPDHLDYRKLVDEIDPIKDVDGVTCVQAGMLYLGLKDKTRLVPWKAQGLLYAMDYLDTLLFEETITILGNSDYLGKPLAILLQEKHKNISIIDTMNKNDITLNNIDKYNIKIGDIITLGLVSLMENICIAYDNQFDFIWNYCKNLSISESALNYYKK